MRTFKLGDRVTKTRGSNWTGRVVGTYRTKLTPEGYAVESETECGSVQIYPVSALQFAPAVLPGDPREGWIDWAGGECPVLDCVRVDVKFRDGDIAENHDPAGWIWQHACANPWGERGGRDIIAYRLSDAPA